MSPYTVFGFATIGELQDGLRDTTTTSSLQLDGSVADAAGDILDPVGDDDGSKIRDDGSSTDDDTDDGTGQQANA